MTDEIKLPPLPHADVTDPGRFGVAYYPSTMAMYARTAVEANRSGCGDPVQLIHMAVIDDGELRMMSGRKPVDCELYAMPDMGRAPDLYLASQPTESSKELSLKLEGLADRAYCQYIEQLSRKECKGVEYKQENGTFGVFELAAHNKAHEYLGRHRAFSEAAQLLRSACQPVPVAQEPVGFDDWWDHEQQNARGRLEGDDWLDLNDGDKVQYTACWRAALRSVAARPMVDMGPPATSRDRWMYEQGRLAERDPRAATRRAIVRVAAALVQEQS